MYKHDSQDLMSKKAHPTSEQRTERFGMRASPEMMKRVDEWRRQQPDLPSRTEAIHRLTDAALEAEAAKKKGGKR